MKTPIDLVPLTPARALELAQANEADNGHCAPLATHIFTRGAEIVGAAALCAPAVTFWADSRKNHPRESVEMVLQAKLAALKQQERFLVLCSGGSPFHPHMARFGFRLLGNADVYFAQRDSE